MNYVECADLSAQVLSISITGIPAPEFRQALSKGLEAYNRQTLDLWDNEPLNVFVIDGATEKAIGGLAGRTSLGVFFIDLLCLPSHLRGKGLGRDILSQAEAESRRRGCFVATVYTMMIQAPSFYRKQGYQEFGRVGCRPEGNARIFMRKILSNES